MRVIAVYNMKGGVGKTTAAVNLSYLAAAGGQRVLLWDLDPQAASSYAFRIRPHVEGFSRKNLKNGDALAAEIKQTDYGRLDLLPADFAYRKLDRLLDELSKPRRVVTTLVESVGQDYDLLFLDCPAGFSLLTEGVFAAADAVLVPTVPTILSLRMVARLIKWADRSESSAVLAAFFSMVDRRKTLHRRATEWSQDYEEVFLAGLVPYASVVEQMTVKRTPLAVFAPHDPATAAFATIWAELESRLARANSDGEDGREHWKRRLSAIETLLGRLDSPDGETSTAPNVAPVIDMRKRSWGRTAETEGAASTASPFVRHRFDTEDRDLERRGVLLELHEREGSWMLVISSSSGHDAADAIGRAQVQVDRSWAFEILSGTRSPLVALERRLGSPGPVLLESARAAIGDRPLHRIDSQVADGTPGEHGPTRERLPSTIRQAV